LFLFILFFISFKLLFFPSPAFSQIKFAEIELISRDSLVDFKDNLLVGEKVIIKGIVAVKPGILGVNIFYVNGFQVYSYYKDFPELKPGDKISVQGEISISQKEKRIKIKKAKDIKILDSNFFIVPEQYKIDEINDSLLGFLIKTKGLVIEKTSGKIFLDDNENEKELIIYFKKPAEIDLSGVEEGDWLEVVGILSRNNEELRLLPRSNKDLIVFKQKQVEENYKDLSILSSLGQIPEYKPSSILANLGKTNEKERMIDFKKISPYFFIISFFFAVVLLVKIL